MWFDTGVWYPYSLGSFNTLRSGQNGRQFPDDIWKCIFMNDNVWILFIFSLKFVPKVLIDIISVLVQIMAWRRLGDKPLSEPMMISLLTHICVARPQWVNLRVHKFNDAFKGISWSKHHYLWCSFLGIFEYLKKDKSRSPTCLNRCIIYTDWGHVCIKVVSCGIIQVMIFFVSSYRLCFAMHIFPTFKFR